MRALSALILLLVAGPGSAWGQLPRDDAAALRMAASVFTAALTFIAPRTLDPLSVRQLAVWGLNAPSALDDALSTTVRDDGITLSSRGVVVLQLALPADDSAASWGALLAEVMAAAARSSPQVASAGAQGLVSAVFDEVFSHMDPYSRYIPPEDAGEDRVRRNGESGVGIQIRPQGRELVVSDVNADGSAAAAGVRVGDRLIAVDDQRVAGELPDTVRGWILGLEGTGVSLTVRRRGGPARTLALERSVIPPETVFASRAGPNLLVRIIGFSRDTDERLGRELERFLGSPGAAAIKGVVIDLRGNRGGLLPQAVAATDLLMNEGVIASTLGREPRFNHRYEAEVGDLSGGRPIVVLVNGRSASAAEIMAAALSDNGRAVVVGSDTLGKGLVQAKIQLPDDGELFVSTSRVLAPGGWPLQGLGVMPQLCTSRGADVTQQQMAALDRGTAPMAEALVRHHAARAPLSPADVLALRNPCPAAESRDGDMVAARFLLGHPRAYAAALLAPP